MGGGVVQTPQPPPPFPGNGYMLHKLVKYSTYKHYFCRNQPFPAVSPLADLEGGVGGARPPPPPPNFYKRKGTGGKKIIIKKKNKKIKKKLWNCGGGGGGGGVFKPLNRPPLPPATGI